MPRWCTHILKEKEKKIKRGQEKVEGQNLIKSWLITSAFCYHPDVTASTSSEQVHEGGAETRE